MTNVISSCCSNVARRDGQTNRGTEHAFDAITMTSVFLLLFQVNVPCKVALIVS